jgi:hypothetical protein
MVDPPNAYRIYKAAQALIDAVVARENITDEEFDVFTTETADAAVLLSTDDAAYLAEMRDNAIQLRQAFHEINEPGRPTERAQLATWFSMQTQVLQQRYRTYLARSTLTVRTFFPDSEIYSSGAITIRDFQKPLTIQILPPETGVPYDIKVTFSRIEGKDGSVDWSIADRGLNLNLINFDSPLGLTMHNPVPLGTYDGKPLLLDFVVYTLGDSATAPKLFCYTLRAGSLSRA